MDAQSEDQLAELALAIRTNEPERMDAQPEDQLAELALAIRPNEPERMDAQPEDQLAELALAIRPNEPDRIKLATASYSQNCARRWTVDAVSRQETMLVPTPPPRRATIGCMPRDQPSSRWRRRRYRESGTSTLKPPCLREMKSGAEENIDPAPSMDTFVTRRRRPLDDATPDTGATGRDESCRVVHFAALVDSPKTSPRSPRPPRAKELRRSGGGLTNLFRPTSERPKTSRSSIGRRAPLAPTDGNVRCTAV